MVTIYDIAKQCNVSAATVSKALNDYADVSPKTKKRILETATAMGYAPNFSARTLSTKRSYNIGIVFDEESNRGLSHELFSKVLESIRHHLGQEGYVITFISKGQTSYLTQCKHRQVDGVIVVCTDFISDNFKELVNGSIPAVIIDILSPTASSVISDNYAGMCALVEHLIELGHKDIGYIHGQVGASVTLSRLKAFHDTLGKHGIIPNPEWIDCSSYYCVDTTYNCAKTMLTATHKPTALILPDDYATLALYNLSKELNIAIPDELSIAGFDGIELTQFLNPSLTTVQQDTYSMGYEASKRLLSLIQSPTDFEVVTIPTKLIVGRSTGPLT